MRFGRDLGWILGGLWGHLEVNMGPIGVPEGAKRVPQRPPEVPRASILYDFVRFRMTSGQIFGLGRGTVAGRL